MNFGFITFGNFKTKLTPSNKLELGFLRKLPRGIFTGFSLIGRRRLFVDADTKSLGGLYHRKIEALFRLIFPIEKRKLGFCNFGFKIAKGILITKEKLGFPLKLTGLPLEYQHTGILIGSMILKPTKGKTGFWF